MTARAAFLRAIGESPDDDAPRLVFADWLDERGERVLAEFVRLQIALDPLQKAANAKAEYDHETFVRLFRRENELIRTLPDQLPAEWKRVAGLLVAEDSPAVRYRRGLIESAAFPADAWLAHADAILAEHPVVEVRLTTVPPDDFLGFVEATTRGDPEPWHHHPRWPTVRFRLPPEGVPAREWYRLPDPPR